MALSKPGSKEELAKFEIRRLEELEGGKCSGSGSFGTVFKVKVDGVTRIAKRLHNVLIEHDIRPEDRDGIRERFCTECLLLSKLDHPCIVQFVGVHFHGLNRSDVILVMECLHTDLERFLDPKERPNIPLSIKLSILLDVSAGLFYLHHQLEEPLVHRDLKPENILITNDVRAKIADLGVSKLLKNYPHHAAVQTKCPGTLAYMPPEALCENPQYDTSLDIFSYGQLALYTAIQQFPQVFNVVRDPKMTSAIRLGESEILRRKKWIDLLGEHHCLREIILQCLKDDSTNRPKTSELKNTMNTLCVIHPKSSADVVSIMDEKADVIELKRKNAQLMNEKAQMEQALTSKVEDVRALKLELKKMKLLIKEKQQLQDQVKALQLQRLMHDDGDASVLETVLKENSELQKKNTRLLKKLCDNEKTIKSYTSQLQNNKEEIKRLKKISDKPRTAPVKVQAQYKVQPSHQRLADEKVALEDEVSRLNQESSKLRESLDQVTHGTCISGYEARIKEIRKQAEQVEVKYQVEREEKERLNSEVQHLQEQFKSLLAVHVDGKSGAHSSDDNVQGNAVISRLQGRIKQLNEDLTSLREHSKTQSRQIIVLRQKAELTKRLEEQVASIDSLLIEGERDDLKRKLIHLAATDDESDIAERQRKHVQLDPKDADAVEIKRKNAQLTNEKAQLEQALTSKVEDVRALKLELKNNMELLMKEKQQLQDQVEALQLQVTSYKSDFEEERRDRAATHAKMADMEKEIAQLKGLSSHEKAESKYEVGELEKYQDTYKEVLQDRQHKLQFATEQLEKHKIILHDLETVHSIHVQEAGKQIQELTSQVAEANSELQAKVSQVKQYAKENEKVKGKNEQLKLQLSTTMTSLGVMAEEMDKDRRKAFELQGKLDKFRKGATAKGIKDCEATEKRNAKLEKLYNTAVIDVQSLTVEKEELTKQVGELLREKRVCPLQHGSSPATTPAMTKLNQMQLIPSASSQQRSATCEQPLRAGPTDDIISDGLGTAGAGIFLPGHTIPPSQQLPLRARAPDGPPQGDPDKHSTQTKANPHGMSLPLKSKQEATGRGDKQSFSPQRPFSPKRSAKNPPTVQASGGDDYTYRSNRCVDIARPVNH